MCRLYGFRSNRPTRPECALVRAQNALMTQSARDHDGQVNGDGWGIAAYQDGEPTVVRRTRAAFSDAEFPRLAERIRARTIVAHVRAASVGRITLANTHPFVAGRWALAHNGTLPGFAALRPEILAEIAPEHRAAIAGETDSEHVFRLLLTRIDAAPERPLRELIAETARALVNRCRARDSAARIGLNLILTDGARMVGTRLGRTLYHLRRDRLLDCATCGLSHADTATGDGYRAAVVASEPLTDEPWQEVPQGSAWEITPDFGIAIAPF